MDRGNVVDLAAARRRRLRRARGCWLRDHALDKCVEMYRRGDWGGFGYWHAVYLRERRRLGGEGGNGW